MNKTNHFFTRGLCVFAFLTADMLAILYAAQARMMWLLLACVITGILLSLGLLFLLLFAGNAIEKCKDEIQRLRQREKSRVQKKQQAIEESARQNQDVFNGEEILARIMPSAETSFENAAAYTEKMLQNIAKELDIVQGLVFVLSDADQLFHISGEYAYYSEEQPRSFPLGETLSGQVAKNRQLLNVKEMPEDYITVLSGLGKCAPRHLLIAPILHGDESIGVMELASFKPFGENEESLVRNICDSMAVKLNELRK